LAEGESHPCQEVVVQVWPLLLKVFQKYASESRVIERCCRCVRYAVRNLEQHSSFLLHPLVALLVDLYQRYPHSCCLYLGSIMVDMFGTDPTCSPLLFDMLQALVVPTMSVLERPDGLQNSPDVVDDLFRLGSRCLYKMPVPYLQSPISKSVFACGVNACAVSHSEANASVVRYLYEFINLAKTKEDQPDFAVRRQLVLEVLSQHGELLVTSVLVSCVEKVPSRLIAGLSDIVSKLFEIDQQQTSRWLETALARLPTHKAGGSVTATIAQRHEFIAEVAAATGEGSVREEFEDFAKLFR
jgi:transportin-3